MGYRNTGFATSPTHETKLLACITSRASRPLPIQATVSTYWCEVHGIGRGIGDELSTALCTVDGLTDWTDWGHGKLWLQLLMRVLPSPSSCI